MSRSRHCIKQCERQSFCHFKLVKRVTNAAETREHSASNSQRFYQNEQWTLLWIWMDFSPAPDCPCSVLAHNETFRVCSVTVITPVMFLGTEFYENLRNFHELADITAESGVSRSFQWYTILHDRGKLTGVI